MKLNIVESTTGIVRKFDAGSPEMTVQYFIKKISELYSYDKYRVKLLYMSQVLNKDLEERLSYWNIKNGDTLHVMNFQAQNSYVTHLSFLQEQHKKGITKVKKLPTQVQPKLQLDHQGVISDRQMVQQASQGGHPDFQSRLMNSLSKSKNVGSQGSSGADSGSIQFRHARNKYTQLYSKFTGQIANQDKMDAKSVKDLQMVQNNSGSKIKKSPFKKAGEYIKRMSNLSNSAENNDRQALEDDGEIFAEADCQNTQQQFHSDQSKDTYGKEQVDERMVMMITGAKEILKKPKRERIGIFGDQGEVNIMDLLQLFRETHDQRGRENQNQPQLPNMLMAMAQSDIEGEGSGDELDSANHFGEENDDNPLGNNFSLMQINNAPGQRDRDQNRGGGSSSQVLGSGSGGRPSLGQGLRRGSDRSQQLFMGSSSSQVSGLGGLQHRQGIQMPRPNGRIAEMDDDDDDMADFQSEFEESSNNNGNPDRAQANDPIQSIINARSGGGNSMIGFGNNNPPIGFGENRLQASLGAGGPQRSRENDPMEFGRFFQAPRQQNNVAQFGVGGGNNSTDASRHFLGAFGMSQGANVRIIRANDIGRHSQPTRTRADPNHVQTLMEMGFSKSQCKAALKQNKNNLERCIDKLLTNGDQFIGIENSDDSDGAVESNQSPIQNQALQQQQQPRGSEGLGSSQQNPTSQFRIVGSGRMGGNVGSGNPSEMQMPAGRGGGASGNSFGGQQANAGQNNNVNSSGSHSGSVPGIVWRQNRP